MLLSSRLVLVTAAALCLPGLAGSAAPQTQESAPTQTGAFASVRDFVDEQIERGRYRAAVALVERDGEVVLDLAAGDAGQGEPIAPDAIFRIYSMSKAVTAAAAMMLVEDERLDLDAPVARYLPELAEVEVLVEGPGAKGSRRVPCDRPMIVRDLLTHTAGFTYGFFGDTEADRLLRAANVFAPGVTNESMVERLEGVPLKHQPGTTFEYGISSDVLGRVLEVVSEKPLGTLLEERLFGPLGMVDTGFDVPEEKRGRVATCFVRDGRQLRPARGREALDPRRPATHQSGGGGLYSTAADYMKFCRLLLNEGAAGEVRLLTKASVQEMTRDHLDGRPAAMLAWTGGAFGYGMAVLGLDRPRGPREGSVWWGGIAGTAFWVDRESGTTGVFMIQTMNEVMHATTFRSRVYAAMGR